MIARVALTLAGMTLAVAVAVAVSAQDAAVPVVPAAATQAPDTLRTGPQLFADKCVYCHDARGWGTRSLARRSTPGQEELLQRDMLPAVLVRYAVRRGVGSMPQFTPTEISDAELEVLAIWLDALN